MAKRCFRLGCISPGVWLFCLLNMTVAHAGDPADWLMRMAEAVERRNYEGTLVYMSNRTAETFKVYHRVADDGVVERVVALDGAGAEIIRKPDELICIFPAQQSVVVESRSASAGKGNPLKSSLPRYSAVLQSTYELNDAGSERVLGRDARVISIDPRDDYRYGYRLWLDAATALPLKLQLLGEQQMPLEEIRFTELELPELVKQEVVQTHLDTSAFVWTRQSDSLEVEVVEPDGIAGGLSWESTDLPAGFRLQMDTLRYTGDGNTPRQHLVYSDGLATVSVFVDVGVAAAEQVEGPASMGTSNAYSLLHDGLLVTAMGEVPARTVERIAMSMRSAALQ